MIHDQGVERVLSGTGSLRNLTLAQVSAMRYKEKPDEGLPTLEDVRAMCII